MSSHTFCFLVFTVSPFVIWTGLALAFVWPMRLGWRGTVALLAVFAAAVAKSFWYLTFGGHVHYPDLPEFVCNLTGLGYAFCALLFLVSIWPPYRGGLRRALVRVSIAGALTAWGAYEAMRIPAAQSHEIAVEGLPPAFDGMRVVQISDLHCSPAARRDYIQGLVAQVNSLKPDLVCITGDFVDGDPKLREADMAPLAGLKAKWGVYGCMGNHECYSGYHAWRPIFTKFGIRMLDNAHVVITNGVDRLVLGGVTDKTAPSYYVDGQRGGKAKDKNGRLRRKWPGPNVKAAFSNAPPDVCRILLQHRPADVVNNAKNGVKLQLSGHTHGAPIWGAGWLIGKMNEGHSVGLYHDHGLTLYVTPGAGQWVGFPLRMGVPSEISELTLRSGRRSTSEEVKTPFRHTRKAPASVPTGTSTSAARTILAPTRPGNTTRRTGARGGNLLLLVNLDAQGAIPKVQDERLLSIGKWLARYGEAMPPLPYRRERGKTIVAVPAAFVRAELPFVLRIARR